LRPKKRGRGGNSKKEKDPSKLRHDFQGQAREKGRRIKKVGREGGARKTASNQELTRNALAGGTLTRKEDREKRKRIFKKTRNLSRGIPKGSSY